MNNTECTIPDDVLNELYARFILNLPKSTKERCSEVYVRIFFEIEYAHWFYLDNFCSERHLVYINMYDFTSLLFERYPGILPSDVDWRKEYDEWRRYKASTPTSGAIVLDRERRMILLVKGFWNNRWSFPGGKLNEDESYESCSAREVKEETGLDIEPHLNPGLYIEFTIGDTPRRQYIVEGMPVLTGLQPTTKNEIEAITWFNIDDLPKGKSDLASVDKLQIRAAHFFIVIPYIRQLQAYIDYRDRGFPPLDALAESAREMIVREKRRQKQLRQSSDASRSDTNLHRDSPRGHINASPRQPQLHQHQSPADEAAVRQYAGASFHQRSMAIFSDNPFFSGIELTASPLPALPLANKSTSRGNKSDNRQSPRGYKSASGVDNRQSPRGYKSAGGVDNRQSPRGNKSDNRQSPRGNKQPIGGGENRQSPRGNKQPIGGGENRQSPRGNKQPIGGGENRQSPRGKVGRGGHGTGTRTTPGKSRVGVIAEVIVETTDPSYPTNAQTAPQQQYPSKHLDGVARTAPTGSPVSSARQQLSGSYPAGSTNAPLQPIVSSKQRETRLQEPLILTDETSGRDSLWAPVWSNVRVNQEALIEHFMQFCS